MFPLVIYCLSHQWNHRVTGYEFCNRVEPKLEPKPITTSTREGPNFFQSALNIGNFPWKGLEDAFLWDWKIKAPET